MKEKLNDQLLIGFILGMFAFLTLQYILVHIVELPVTSSYKDVGGNIDIEYYLEVSEDSIWVESVDTKKVYSGKYSDLDSLIMQDNL
jgi:hypothetical protein